MKALILPLLPILLPATAHLQTLEVFPNFHTLGINIQLPEPDPEKDAWATLEYADQTGIWHPGFRLSRVNGTPDRLSGCIFWAEPGATYEVRVTVQDSTTPTLQGLQATGSGTARLLPVLPEPERILYVSPVGSDTLFTEQNPGALADALVRVQPGDQVRLLGGRYFFGDFEWPTSGLPGSPVSIVGQPGDTVVLDGSSAAPLLWTPHSSIAGLYFTTSSANNPNLVLADGRRLYPHQTLEDLMADQITVGINFAGPVTFPAKADGFYRNPSDNPFLNPRWQYPNLLWVKFRDNSDPNLKQMAVSTRARCFHIDGHSNLYFRNLTFSNYGKRPGGVAVDLVDASDVVFDACRFGVNDVGLLLEGAPSRVTVQHCAFFDAEFGWDGWMAKATYDDYNPYSAIFPYYSRLLETGGLMYQHGFKGRGIVVRGCSFHDFGQAGHGSPPSRGPGLESNEIDFYENHLYRCFEDGIEVDGDGRNVRIFNNEFERCNAPVSLAMPEGGPVYVLRNVFHDLQRDTFFYIYNFDAALDPNYAHPFKLQFGNAGTPDSIGSDLFFFHNTVIINEETAGLDFYSPGYWQSFTLRNNLVAGTGFAHLYVRTKSRMPIDLDYTLYYSPDDTYRFLVDTNTTDAVPTAFLGQLGDLQEQFPYDAHSLTGDPHLLPDFHLADTSSAAVDRGVLIPGINDLNYLCDAPDIGAFELSYECTLATNQPAIDRLRIMPSPNMGSFWVELPETENGLVYVQILDLNGKKVWENVCNGSKFQIDLSPASHPGLHLLRVTSGKNLFTGKWVLEPCGGQ